MNNLPLGVSETTEDAPWNEEFKTIIVTAFVTQDVTVPIDYDDLQIEELRMEASTELERALVHTDFTFEEIIAEEM